MLRFTVLRLVRGIITIWLVVTLVFFGIRLSGDPVELMLGENAPPEAVEELRRDLGLDDPIPVQYVRYIETVVRADFGESLREHRPVTTVVLDRLPATLELASISIAVTLLIGLPAGVIAALRRNSRVDRAVMAVNFFGQAAPSFFVGIILILIFSLWLRWLPSSGRGGTLHLVMPVATMSLHGAATFARLTRSSVLEIMNQEYIRTARAKGLGRGAVISAHIMRNAAIPIVTMLGLIVGTSIAGAVIVETVFAWPGMGRLVANAVFQRDYPVIQFIVLLIATSVVLVNFVVDLMYGWLDPRIRLGS
jgi:peptide/nickel transport system permease protein